MRIVCQKCAAAYAIDDRLISPKGVRAQCPRCRHLQLVKKEAGAPEAAPPGPAPQPAATPRPQPSVSPAEANSALAVDLFNEFGTVPDASPLPPDPLFDGLMDAPPPPPARPGPPVPARPAAPVPARLAAPPPSASRGDPLLDFLGPAPESPPPPVALAPRRATGPSMPASPPQGMAPQGPRPQAPAPAPAAPAPAPAVCRECNKPLTDPFDQAIGTCEDCRHKQDAAQVATAVTSGAPASAPSFDLPPLESIDMSGVSAEAPALALEPRSGVRSSPPRPSSAYSQPPQQLEMRRSGSGGLLKVLVALLAVAGLGGAGYFFLVMKPKATGPVTQVKPPAPPPLPAAIQAVIPRWELRYMDLNGSGMDKIDEGTKLLAKDQRAAYADAEESFQQAFLMDPRNDAAIAGYVEAVALGRGTSIDNATFEEALSLIEAAEERAGRSPLMLLAHANLLMCRPSQTQLVEQARQLAEEALVKGTDFDKGEAHLVLGRAYLQTSMALANQHFDEALILSPNLQRVQYHRALANEAVGAYTLALAALKERLQKDPEHWDSLVTMARIYLEVGEVEEARKLYEARAKAQPNDVRVLLALAELRYQVDLNAAGAVKELRALLKNRQRYSHREVAEVLAHLAAAERMAGNVDAGVKAAEEAVGLIEDLPAAHLQLLLAALAKGDAAKAAIYLPGIQGKLEDPALEKVLEGRLRLAEKKPAEALEVFQEAFKLDPRREDALLLTGIAAAQAGRRDDAFRVFFQALQADPLRPTPRPVTTEFFLRPGETLAGMAGSIQALGSSKDDLGASLYEGLLLYHLGERPGAERLFKEVLELDPNNGGAAAYLSLLALQKGEGNKARTLAARAVVVGRQMPVAHLAQGLALLEGKQVEPAKRALRDALSLAPRMLSAEVKLAELDLTAHPEDARERLVRVAGLDPTYLPAKRLLFTTDQRR
jgi:predicted Zn finger-like uncharacterized protein